MSQHPKILIGTLFSEVKDYIIRDFFKHVSKFTYPNIEICLVDNSKDKKYHKKTFNYFSTHKKNSNIKKITVLHTPRIHKKPEVFMAFSAIELRKFFLRNKYDFLLNLECDIFPPLDIIERLLCYNHSIVGATYFSGDKSNSYLMLNNMYIYDTKGDVMVANAHYLDGFYSMGDTFSLNSQLGQGIGCVLIGRDIVEKIPFRSDPNEILHYDSIFYYDLLHNNIGNKLAPILCRHENQTWDIQHKLIGS